MEQALADPARAVGKSLGRRAREKAGGTSKRSQLVDAICHVLDECAYQPRRDGHDLTLVNCPFHSLAQQYRDLVCGMNLALIAGLTDELEGARLSARLDPGPGHCCVRLIRRGA